MPEITPDSVIVKVNKAGLCGTDHHFFETPMIPKVLVVSQFEFNRLRITLQQSNGN